MKIVARYRAGLIIINEHERVSCALGVAARERFVARRRTYKIRNNRAPWGEGAAILQRETSSGRRALRIPSTFSAGAKALPFPTSPRLESCATRSVAAIAPLNESTVGA